MKTLKDLSMIAAIAAMMIQSSCLNSGSNNYSINTKFPDLFNAVVTNDGEVTLYPKQSIQVQWQYGDDMVADIQLIGLQLPGLSSMPTLEFDSKPWTLNSKGWMDVTMTDVKPDASGGYASNLTFNRFNLQTISRSYNGVTFPPCLSVNYTVNNEFHVYTLPSEIIEVGRTTVTEINTGSSFVQDENSRSIYYIELDAVTKKGFLVIQGAQFASNMPGLNMKFPNIPFEVTQYGAIVMSADEIEPALMTSSSNINDPGTPAPSYPITEFRATYISEKGVNISFICTPHTKDGKEMGKYRVNFECEYPINAQQANL